MEITEKLKELDRAEENLIFQLRAAGHFAPAEIHSRVIEIIETIKEIRNFQVWLTTALPAKANSPGECDMSYEELKTTAARVLMGEGNVRYAIIRFIGGNLIIAHDKNVGLRPREVHHLIVDLQKHLAAHAPEEIQHCWGCNESNLLDSPQLREREHTFEK